MTPPQNSRISLALLCLIGAAGLALLAINLHVQLLRFQLYRAQGTGFTDPACAVAYCDFSVFWLSGELARQHAAGLLYNSAEFLAFGAHRLNHHTGFLPFFYPPVSLLPAAIMSLPPLAAGYYLFTVISLGVSILLLRLAGIPWRCIVIGLASPAATWCLYLGQFGLLCGALLICGIARIATTPLRSGALLAALAIKPQYALLVPVVVLASLNWRAIAAGAAVVLLLLMLPAICFGWPFWAQYFAAGRAEAAAVLNAPFKTGYEGLGSSIFWMLRSFGAGLATAYTVQAAASALSFAFAWRLWRRPAADPAARLAATVFLTLLASPYGYTDDMVAYSIMLPVLARPSTPLYNLLLATLWLAPALVPDLVRHSGILPTPFLVLTALALACQRLRAGSATASPLALTAG